jgi:uncharacterized protein YndB with AHSA1/START domain
VHAVGRAAAPTERLPTRNRLVALPDGPRYRATCQLPIGKTAMTDPGTDRIETAVDIAAPPARVWRALVDAEEFGAWFGVALAAGGSFIPGQQVHGRITHPGYEHLVFKAVIERVERERTLSFRWHPYAIDPALDYSREATTLVVFELRASVRGTSLRVVESGFDALPPARRLEALRMNRQGWDAQTKNIERHVGAA